MTVTKDQILLGKLRFQLTVTSAMLGTLELDQILYIILSGITHGEGLGFNRAFLFLSEDSGQELKAYTAVGPTTAEEAHHIWESMEQMHLDLDRLLAAYEASAKDPRARALTQCLAGFSVPLSAASVPIREGDSGVPLQALVARAAATRQAFFFNRVEAQFEPPLPGGGSLMVFRKMAVVPLVQKDTVIGVILADNTFNGRDVRPEDMDGMTTLANLAAIAIDRARAHQRLKEMAAVDGLSGVCNRRHYELRLQQEISRAQRNGRPLSLLLFDIDRFKNINDSAGHEAGDRVLKDLAGILRGRVRNEDLVARYGGDEFVVLLTGGATAEESSRVAEKLRQEIAERPLGDQPVGAVTVSVGVAFGKAETMDGTELFRLADRALYRAKQEGRNRVCSAS
ncbi:MAG: sensor domain-containing diguanylate cyclase [Myxococcales bacterium]|nr:sensor domain-containing diguanylate cyclase [Myxococcales bacterium]